MKGYGLCLCRRGKVCLMKRYIAFAVLLTGLALATALGLALLQHLYHGASANDAGFPERLARRIVLETAQSAVERRTVYYDEANRSKLKEEIELRNGNRVLVVYGPNQVLKETVEYFAANAEGSKPVAIRRKTVFTGGKDRPVLALEDRLVRRDGTLAMEARLLSREPPFEFEKRYYREDGSRLVRKTILDVRKRAWSIKRDEVFFESGAVQSEASRLDEGGYERKVFSAEGTLLRKQIWNSDRTALKAWIYAPRSNAVLFQVSESGQDRNIIFYDRQGRIDHMIDLFGEFEVATIYDGNGVALFRQMWSVKSVENLEGSRVKQRKLAKLESVRAGGDFLSRKIFFLEKTETPVFILEESENEFGHYRRRSRTFDAEGWLVADQTVNEVDKVIDNPTVKPRTVRYPRIDPDWLLYREHYLPDIQLQEKWWQGDAMEFYADLIAPAG